MLHFSLYENIGSIENKLQFTIIILSMSNQNFSRISFNSHVLDMHRNVAGKERHKYEVAQISATPFMHIKLSILQPESGFYNLSVHGIYYHDA